MGIGSRIPRFPLSFLFNVKQNVTPMLLFRSIFRSGMERCLVVQLPRQPYIAQKALCMGHINKKNLCMILAGHRMVALGTCVPGVQVPHIRVT